MSAPATNLLVISDLHLGDGIRVDKAPANTCDELCQFIEYYTDNRRDQLPWRLVINGDMVDFIGICIMPDEAGLISNLHPDDHYYGLGNRPHAAALKMTHVLSHHKDVFRAMARFIGIGNQVTIVVGNHDAAFHFVEVQQALRTALIDLWNEDDTKNSEITAQTIGDSLDFCPWFYFEEGVAWIEHGHQYDPYCSFDSVLDPATDEHDLDPNVDSALLHYVANHFMPQRAASWGKGFFWYLRWAINQGATKLITIYSGYQDMVLNLLQRWRRRTFNTNEQLARRARHREALKALALKAKLPEEVLVKLHNLRKQPIINELRTLIQGLMLDRLLLLVAGPALILLPLLLSWPLNIIAWLCSVIILIPWVKIAYEPRITSDPRVFMHQVTSTIRQQTKVPIVVFGHSHDAKMIQDEQDNGLYINSGSWVPHTARNDLGAFTHVLIHHTDNGIKAMLCQWRDGKSLVLS